MKEKTVCPLCGQPIPPKKMKEYEKKFAEKIEIEANKKLQTQIQEKERQHKKEIIQLKSNHEKEKEELSLDLKEDFQKELRDEFRELYSKRLSVKDKDIEKLRMQIDELQRSAQKKTPTEFGDEGQENLLLYLQEEFPNDEITETQKGKEGADIFQYVKYKNQTCGLIIYEVKNVKKWSNNFIEQANKEKTIHGTPHVILVTNVFPAKENNICERDGIMIVSQSKSKYIANFIRKYLIDLQRSQLSHGEQEIKVERLYQYLNSEGFKTDIGTHFRSVKKLRDLQDKELRSHKKTWAKQRKEFETLHYHISNIESEISSIIEGKVPVIKIIPIAKKKKKQLIIENQIVIK